MNRQAGFSIPIAIFVLVVIGMLGAAMVNILNQGQESIAREILSMRAFMAAESGVERGLNEVLVGSGGALCAANNLNDTANFNTLFNWSLSAPGMTGCAVSVTCGTEQLDADGDGSNENYFAIRAAGECGPTNNRAHRIVQVQAR